MLWCRDEASVEKLRRRSQHTVQCHSEMEALFIVLFRPLLKRHSSTWEGNHSFTLSISICAALQRNLFFPRPRQDWTLHLIDPYWLAAYNSRVPLRVIAQLLNAGDLAVFLRLWLIFVFVHQYVDWSGADLVLSQPNQMHGWRQAHQYIN